ncbi:MAG: hypothetical protein ACOCRO_05765 [Halanaerobiales bacterium]
MAKLKKEPIVKDDLVEYLEEYSDFSFELKVLNSLIDMEFSCEHGGTYTDPITKKTREFDIRATRVFNKRFLRLAVECKNLRPNFPLLISCLPRRQEEAFHEILFSVNPREFSLTNHNDISGLMMPQERSKNIRLKDNYSLYKPNQEVGKSCSQVGRDNNDNIYTGDTGIYEKWSQALSSADDLTYLACTDGEERTGDVAMSLVFPVLVVPDNMLWVTHYDLEGRRVKDPERVDRCSYYIYLTYSHIGMMGEELNISHLEFVTYSGLKTFINNLVGDEENIQNSFPYEHIIERIKENKNG